MIGVVISCTILAFIGGFVTAMVVFEVEPKNNMIHEEICTYEVAKLAKEKGFPLRKVIKQDGRAFFYELPQSQPE